MNRTDGQILEEWLQNPSFIQWCTKPDSRDFERWEKWLEQNPHRRELAELGSSIVKGIKIREKTISEEMSKASLNQVLTKIDFTQEIKTNEIGTRFGNRFTLKIAATILLLIGATFFFYQRDHNLKVILSTNFGEKLELVLPDQTQVILNANSTLEYNRKNPRDVLVEGEVFFHVKKKPESGEKFMVRTRNLVVEVLGTSFNVNTHFEETEVYLQEGQIKLDLGTESGSDPLLMEPGDLFKYTASRTPILEKRKLTTQEKTDWTDGSIEFEHIELPDILSRLTRIYGFSYGEIPSLWEGKSISVGIPINDEKLTLEILSKTLGLEVKRVDGNWIFIPTE